MGEKLLSGGIGTLTDDAPRKAALGDERRYAILYYLWDREEVARKELAEAVDDPGLISPTSLENSLLMISSLVLEIQKIKMAGRRSTGSRISGSKRPRLISRTSPAMIFNKQI